MLVPLCKLEKWTNLKTLLHLLEICYNKLIVLEQDTLLLPVRVFLQKIFTSMTRIMWMFLFLQTWHHRLLHNPWGCTWWHWITQWSFFEGRGSNLTAGMQGFSSGNLFPGILPPILKIITHSASRNLWTLVVWVGCQTNTRSRLLQSLCVHLSLVDQIHLSLLAGDFSPRVGYLCPPAFPIH